jgi:hypothetical protein
MQNSNYFIFKLQIQGNFRMNHIYLTLNSSNKNYRDDEIF